MYRRSELEKLNYKVGERLGRRDGARRWGMRNTSTMSERRAEGYRDGYYSTCSL